MRLSPHYARIARKMAPGVLVRDGMLGSDRRPLPEILDADTASVIGAGLTHQALGARMAELSRAARRGLGESVEIEGRYAGDVQEVQGRMRCPFGDSGAFCKAVTTLTDKQSGETMRWSDLGAHMVEAHGFYQGTGCGWRLEPMALARFVGVIH